MAAQNDDLLRTERVGRGKKGAVIGDGAVGLCGIIASKRGIARP